MYVRMYHIWQNFWIGKTFMIFISYSITNIFLQIYFAYTLDLTSILPWKFSFECLFYTLTMVCMYVRIILWNPLMVVLFKTVTPLIIYSLYLPRGDHLTEKATLFWNERKVKRSPISLYGRPKKVHACMYSYMVYKTLITIII